MEFGKKIENPQRKFENEDFSVSGPRHLTCVDWESEDDCRSTAASLVKGVYVLEGDRKKKRQGEKQLAPKWWQKFQFELIQKLQDERNESFFAAIFEYKGFVDGMTHLNPPIYVLAFRGTIKKGRTVFRDLKLDGRVAFHRTLARDLRYEMSLNALEDLVSKSGSRRIWMVGHSLGAILALRVGKTMALKECYIESYLFNPPFPSVPYQKVKNKSINKSIQVVHDICIAFLSASVKTQSSLSCENDNEFLRLCPWIPRLFVHPRDLICCNYIGYFENRQLMEEIGLGRVNKVAIRSSFFNLIAEAMGKKGEATHLIPSANVTKNMRSNMTLLEAHGIKQWWQQQPNLHTKLHQLHE